MEKNPVSILKLFNRINYSKTPPKWEVGYYIFLILYESIESKNDKTIDLIPQPTKISLPKTMPINLITIIVT